MPCRGVVWCVSVKRPSFASWTQVQYADDGTEAIPWDEVSARVRVPRVAPQATNCHSFLGRRVQARFTMEQEVQAAAAATLDVAGAPALGRRPCKRQRKQSKPPRCVTDCLDVIVMRVAHQLHNEWCIDTEACRFLITLPRYKWYYGTVQQHEPSHRGADGKLAPWAIKYDLDATVAWEALPARDGTIIILPLLPATAPAAID